MQHTAHCGIVANCGIACNIAAVMACVIAIVNFQLRNLPIRRHKSPKTSQVVEAGMRKKSGNKGRGLRGGTIEMSNEDGQELLT